MTAASDQEDLHQGWSVKLRLAIDADNADEAAGRAPHWNIITDLDLSALEPITPDDAVTRFRYVIRNLPGVVFTGPDRDDPRSGLWQWLPDSWELDWQPQELAHPAVRAAGISITVLTKKNRYPGYGGTHSGQQPPGP
jgi:hypothetical protein